MKEMELVLSPLEQAAVKKALEDRIGFLTNNPHADFDDVRHEVSALGSVLYRMENR